MIERQKFRYLKFKNVNKVEFIMNRFMIQSLIFKGSPDPSHFIFEINVGKRWIRHRTTWNLNDAIFNQF